ncbi:hypothetical protein YC2023_071075 [Brassica napus]
MFPKINAVDYACDRVGPSAESIKRRLFGDRLKKQISKSIAKITSALTRRLPDSDNSILWIDHYIRRRQSDA